MDAFARFLRLVVAEAYYKNWNNFNYRTYRKLVVAYNPAALQLMPDR